MTIFNKRHLKAKMDKTTILSSTGTLLVLTLLFSSCTSSDRNHTDIQRLPNFEIVENLNFTQLGLTEVHTNFTDIRKAIQEARSKNADNWGIDTRNIINTVIAALNITREDLISEIFNNTILRIPEIITEINKTLIDTQDDCPKVCKCGFDNITNMFLTNCSRQNLTTLPEVLPIETEYLDISNNYLTVLNKSTLFPLINLHVMDTRGNYYLERLPIIRLRGFFSKNITKIYTDFGKTCCMFEIEWELDSGPAVRSQARDACQADIPYTECSRSLLTMDGYIIYLIIVILSPILNGWVLLVTFGLKKRRTKPTTLLDGHFAIANLLTTIYSVVILIHGVKYYNRYHYAMEEWLHSAGCSVIGYFFIVATLMSTFLYMIDIVEAYAKISNPMREKKHLNLKTTYIILVIFWSLSLLVAAVPLMEGKTSYSRVGLCLPFYAGDYKNSFEFIMLYTAVISSVFLTTNILLVLLLCSVVKGSKSMTENIKKENTRLIRFIAVIIFIYTIFWAFNLVFLFMSCIGGQIGFTGRNIFSRTIVLEAVVNPLIASFRKKGFRKDSRLLFKYWSRSCCSSLYNSEIYGKYARRNSRANAMRSMSFTSTRGGPSRITNCTEMTNFETTNIPTTMAPITTSIPITLQSSKSKRTTKVHFICDDCNCPMKYELVDPNNKQENSNSSEDIIISATASPMIQKRVTARVDDSSDEKDENHPIQGILIHHTGQQNKIILQRTGSMDLDEELKGATAPSLPVTNNEGNTMNKLSVPQRVDRSNSCRIHQETFENPDNVLTLEGGDVIATCNCDLTIDDPDEDSGIGTNETPSISTISSGASMYPLYAKTPHTNNPQQNNFDKFDKSLDLGMNEKIQSMSKRMKKISTGSMGNYIDNIKPQKHKRISTGSLDFEFSLETLNTCNDTKMIKDGKQKRISTSSISSNFRPDPTKKVLQSNRQKKTSTGSMNYIYEGSTEISQRYMPIVKRKDERYTLDIIPGILDSTKEKRKINGSTIREFFRLGHSRSFDLLDLKTDSSVPTPIGVNNSGLATSETSISNHPQNTSQTKCLNPDSKPTVRDSNTTTPELSIPKDDPYSILYGPSEPNKTDQEKSTHKKHAVKLKAKTVSKEMGQPIERYHRRTSSECREILNTLTSSELLIRKRLLFSEHRKDSTSDTSGNNTWV